LGWLEKGGCGKEKAKIPPWTISENPDSLNYDGLVKSLRKDDFVKSSPAKAGQGAQSRETRDRWTFYEVINYTSRRPLFADSGLYLSRTAKKPVFSRAPDHAGFWE
jgi:hypothetical protein